MLRAANLRLIIGFILAHLLLYFSYQDRSIFWYILTGSLLMLITYATFEKEVDDNASFFTYIFFGTVSGLVLYGLFWIGDRGITLLHLPLQSHINRLYRWYAPSAFWNYLALLIVIAPGEEFFWRGFVQKQLLLHFKPFVSIVIGAILYASVQVYSHEMILVFATFLAGLAWGALYFWKKSMPLIIVSHLVFDIMLFIILPLN